MQFHEIENRLPGRSALIVYEYILLRACGAQVWDCLDSRDFYTTNPNWEGDLGTGIYLLFFHIWGQ